jgi:hypothetical protein
MRARARDVEGATAVSGSINLDGGEIGGASAPAAPWFDWKIDYREFSQIYPGPAEQPEEPRPPAKAEVPTLEADIAALVAATADHLRHSENAAPRPRQAAHQVPHLRVVPPSHGEDISPDRAKNVSTKVNEFRPRAWIDIRPGEAVRMVAAGGGLRARPKLRAVVALSLGLAIGWIAVLPLSYFRTYLARAVDAPPSLVQVPRSDGTAARPQASPDFRRDATGTTSAANKGPNHGRRLAQNAAPPKPIKTSLTAAPGVEVTASDSARRSDVGARPMPFPETRPETLSGWTVREVYGGTAILDGPERSFKAARGDIVPGVGRLESIVRWGDRWIVATESGLISTP